MSRIFGVPLASRQCGVTLACRVCSDNRTGEPPVPRKTIFALLALLCALGLLWPAPATAVTIDLVPVGNVGNANDSSDGDNNISGVQNFGAVGYVYNIGKYEVTVGQYTEFLNAVADTDTYSLYNLFMASNLNSAGISQTGSSPNYSYSVIGSAQHPITHVSWGDAARFANWMHNNQPTGAQGPGTTEDGSYFLNGAITNAALNAVVRKPGATWVIPTENEWYKAAYHQPAGQGGDSDNYWAYPTRTNGEPNSDQPPGDVSIQNNAANFYRDDLQANGYNDGYAVSGSASYSSSQYYLTDVGAYSSSPSYYGTFDQGGNVFEWNEALISGSFRGARGGMWGTVSSSLQSSFRSYGNPTDEVVGIGFRVVPEPSTGVLALVGCGLMWVLRKRFK